MGSSCHQEPDARLAPRSVPTASQQSPPSSPVPAPLTTSYDSNVTHTFFRNMSLCLLPDNTVETIHDIQPFPEYTLSDSKSCLPSPWPWPLVWFPNLGKYWLSAPGWLLMESVQNKPKWSPFSWNWDPAGPPRCSSNMCQLSWPPLNLKSHGSQVLPAATESPESSQRSSMGSYRGGHTFLQLLPRCKDACKNFNSDLPVLHIGIKGSC